MATVGSVYAKAVFELANEKGELDQVYSQLKSFWESCQAHPALRTVLTGAGIDPNNRKAVLREILGTAGYSGISRRLLELMCARSRLAFLPEVLRELESMVQSSQGILAGQVRSAVELSSDELAVLSAALAKRVGGKVKLSQLVDPALLGGVVATVAGKTFDASLRTQIERFRNELI